MEESFDFWKLFAGIGLFLWGMRQLEQALKQLAGKSFKNMLEKFTDNRWRGVLIGTIITALLQSSSLVTLMVLAFLGGGLISLRNSLGIVLGANLGTTFTAWVVVALGFKISIADFAFPFLAIGTMTYLFMSSRPNLKNSGIFLVGFGLMFLGLDYMKVAIENMADKIELANYHEYGLWLFLLISVLVTALIQSSSAMIVIILSALNAHIIEMDHALSMVIGANIGTTFTLIIGSLGGSADKKRLALANFTFNGIMGLIAFLLVNHLILVVNTVFSLKDPLINLILLNSLINLMMILFFYPFLNQMERWLGNRFLEFEPKGRSEFIKNVSSQVPSVAIISLQKELSQILVKTLNFIRKVVIKPQGPKKDASVWKKITYQPKDLLKSYNRLKSLEDELTTYGIAIQENNLSTDEANHLTFLMRSIRTLGIGAKKFKDIIHNIEEMENSSEPLVQDLLVEIRKLVSQTLVGYEEIMKFDKMEKSGMNLSFSSGLQQEYAIMIQNLYQHLRNRKTDVSVSTLTNVIQQVFSGLEYLEEGMNDWTLEKENTKDPMING